MDRKEKIVVLSGGFSEEKEVSRITANEIADALQDDFSVDLLDPSDFDSYCELVSTIKEIEPEIVFIGLHGAEGENGQLQALFEMENIDFTGSEHRASAFAMDKFLSGKIASRTEIPVPSRIYLENNDTSIHSTVLEKILFPCVVKPNDSGSSVGISIVENKEDLTTAIDTAFRYGSAVLIEEYIAGRELTVTILGKEALPVVEIVPQNGWYDYSFKYTKGKTEYIVPAELSDAENKQITEFASKIYSVLGCKAYARVDFRFDGKTFYFLEVNTLPGMTPLSLTPMAAEKIGLSFKELLLKIIELSLK